MFGDSFAPWATLSLESSSGFCGSKTKKHRSFQKKEVVRYTKIRFFMVRWGPQLGFALLSSTLR